MPSYLYCTETDSLVSAEEYYFKQYMKKEHLHMTVGNQKVQIYYNPDEMSATRHMSNGKYYTSKKKFRDETRARGCIEVGNEEKTMLTPRKPAKLSKRQRVEDIKKAIYDLKNGNVPR